MDNELHLDVKSIREKHGFTQQAFADALHVSLSIVKKWESKKDPKTYPKTENLLAMCELFKCDLDYLVGRIEEKTHDLKIACELTGLTEAAIEKIRNPELNHPFAKTLSCMIESERFENFITTYKIFLTLLNKIKSSDLDDNIPWYELNHDGVVLGLNQSISHFKQEVSLAMVHICDDNYFQQASQVIQDVSEPFSASIEPGRITIHKERK